VAFQRLLEVFMLDAPPSPVHVIRSGRRPTGAKLALKPLHVWGIRIRLQVAAKCRDLALVDLALDSNLRGCDLVALRVRDVLSATWSHNLGHADMMTTLISYGSVPIHRQGN
jgi:hypothetical protein